MIYSLNERAEQIFTHANSLVHKQSKENISTQFNQTKKKIYEMKIFFFYLPTTIISTYKFTITFFASINILELEINPKKYLNMAMALHTIPNRKS
jgi:hypothetical protein